MPNQRLRTIAIAALLAGGALFVVWQFVTPSDGQTAQSVIVPNLSPSAVSGRVAFDNNCAQCHGENGSGTDSGPPLVHIIYEPNHHGDAAFLLAASNGVRADHWRFGDMPPLPDVTAEMVQEIVGYIRWLQRQVGIE